MEAEFRSKKNTGLTLVEVLVGTALMVIVFVGIFGLIQLSLKVVAQSKARTTASALANQKIELAHNLSYNEVGTVNGVPSGSIPETEDIVMNGITYSIKTTVTYFDDPFDNTMPADPLPLDYKKVKVAVSWGGFLGGSVSFISNIVPKGIESNGTGGVISILVFDADGQPIPQASVHVENSVVVPNIDATYETDNQGRFYLPGAPACSDCYKISVTKAGFSSDRTYKAGEIINGATLATPAKPYLSVFENQQSESSFSIDRLSNVALQTLKYAEEKTWNDSFDDLTKIDSTFQTIASTTLGSVTLDSSEGQYFQTGVLISTPITPTGLVQWGRLNWNQDIASSTQIKYHLLYATSSSWQLIPDEDLTVNGATNSAGFDTSPVDISELETDKYPTVKLEADFRTEDPLATPTLKDWQITWFSTDTNAPVAHLAFNIQGSKTLGTDSTGAPIYKYQQNLSTDANGQATINDLEWDSYSIVVNGATGYDLANSLPTQPINLDPDNDQTATLKLADHHTNTLLVTVKDPGGNSLVGASVRLYKSGYDKLKITSDSGQSFFSPLSTATYTLEIKMAGYDDWSGSVDISGQTGQIVFMNPQS